MVMIGYGRTCRYEMAQLMIITLTLFPIAICSVHNFRPLSFSIEDSMTNLISFEVREYIYTVENP